MHNVIFLLVGATAISRTTRRLQQQQLAINQSAYLFLRAASNSEELEYIVVGVWILWKSDKSRTTVRAPCLMRVMRVCLLFSFLFPCLFDVCNMHSWRRDKRQGKPLKTNHKHIAIMTIWVLKMEFFPAFVCLLMRDLSSSMSTFFRLKR